MTVNYLESRAPDPTQVTLDALLSTVTGVRIIEDGVAGGRAIGDNVLLDESEPRAISAFYTCLAIDESAPGCHCMCLGDYAIELYAGDYLAATLGLHHGRSIRWETGWKHDALLRDGLKLLWWMSTHGLSTPLATFEAERGRAAVAKQAAERWRTAMPECLLPHWEQMRRAEIVPTILHLTLVRAIPEPVAHIRALLSWFGNGAGPWSGYPSYEQVAEELLMLEQTPAIVRSLEVTPLMPPLIAGAARYFASLHFRKTRPNELHLIPERLKAEFLAHGLASASADVRARALRSFGAADPE
jgi:hypothetical protein